MELVPCSLDQLSAATYSFARGELLTSPLPDCPRATVLLVAFDGAAGNTHQDIGTFAFMKAMIVAGLEAWRPEALILDLRRLRYSWGDEMHDTLAAADGWCRRAFPTAVVVSDLNRVGLTSLVVREMGRDPQDLLFDSIDEAVSALDQQQYRSKP